MAKPLFLYLPHQAVHVGNAAEDSHPSYALDQAPIEYIERYAWVEDVERRNLSAMVRNPHPTPVLPLLLLDGAVVVVIR